eukprot:5299580-Prymnesium_polylepis.1
MARRQRPSRPPQPHESPPRKRCPSPPPPVVMAAMGGIGVRRWERAAVSRVTLVLARRAAAQAGAGATLAVARDRTTSSLRELGDVAHNVWPQALVSGVSNFQVLFNVKRLRSRARGHGH